VIQDVKPTIMTIMVKQIRLAEGDIAVCYNAEASRVVAADGALVTVPATETLVYGPLKELVGDKFLGPKVEELRPDLVVRAEIILPTPPVIVPVPVDSPAEEPAVPVAGLMLQSDPPITIPVEVPSGQETTGVNGQGPK
jgi:hypothetical protein